MLQYYNRSNIKVSDGTAVMRDIMQDEQRAAVVIAALYNTNMTVGSTVPVLDMVCQSNLDASYLPPKCYEEEEEDSPDCGKEIGAASLDGAVQSMPCVLGGPKMFAVCSLLTMGVNIFGGAQACGAI